MGEPVALHDITGRTATVDDGAVYEIPAISNEDENGYMKINTLAESMHTFSHGATNDHHTKQVEGDDVSKPGNDAATLRKVQIFCGILLILLIINSVTIGVFIHMLTRRLDATEANSGKISELEDRPGPLTETDTASLQILQTKLEDIESRMEASMKNIDARFQIFSSKITQLEKDRSSHTSMIQDQGSRVTQLEIKSAAIDGNIQKFDSRISQIEINITTDQLTNHKLNNTLTQLAMNISACDETIKTQQTRLNEIESNISLDQNAIQTLNESIKMLATGIDLDIKNSLSGMELLNSSIKILVTNLTDQILTAKDNAFRLNQIETKIEHAAGVRSAFSVNGAMQGVTHGTIRFGRVVTNIGGHYNTSSGNFTCQHPGIYVFHLHLVKFEKQPYAWCNIRMNDADMMAIETSVNNDDTDSHIGSSNSVILNLLHGDIVNIGACSPLYTLHTGLETSFSGFLLQKV